MNDGVIFYWMMWMAWVLSTFLMKKSPFRTRLSFFLLLGIILSGHYVPFSQGKINAAFLFFLCIGFVNAVRNHKHLSNYLISSFVVATSYVTLQLCALYDPVKLIVDKKYFFIFILIVVLLLISKRNNDTLFIYFIGLFIGDSLYQMIIYRLQGFVDIGSDYVMDLLVLNSSILISILTSVDLLKKMKNTAYKKTGSVKQI